jgi:hydroxyethylthiazole kinase-like uncharacterized protein yjeF
MRLGYSARSVRDAEAVHLAAGEPLMQRAAHALALEIRARAEAESLGRPARIVLLVGSGDNGGDALFAAAELAGLGTDRLEVMVVGVGSRMHEAGRAAASAAGAEIVSLDPTPAAAPGVDGGLLAAAAVRAREADVLVDGILGTGTAAGAPALRGGARAIVQRLLAEQADAEQADGARWPIVVAVDLPSGIDPDTGEIADDVVLPASVTVTFGGIKAGLLRGPGARLAGEIVLVAIGIEAELAAAEPLIIVP